MNRVQAKISEILAKYAYVRMICTIYVHMDVCVHMCMQVYVCIHMHMCFRFQRIWWINELVD